MNRTFNTISLLVTSLKNKKLVLSKQEKLSRLSRIKTHVEGRGKRGKRAVSTNVCDFIQIYSRCKLGIQEGEGRGREEKGKGRESARDF